MSAWKKPSRMAWRRNVCISFAPSALTSCPAAASAAWSAIGMPSIHSSVSTRRALRVQSTSGTRKPSSFLMFSAISEMAAASMRKIHLDGDGLRERIDHGDRAEPARADGGSARSFARRKSNCRGRWWKRCSMPGRKHLDRDRLQRAVSRSHLGLVHLGDRGGGDRGSELGEQRVDGGAERLLDRFPRLVVAKRAASGPGA